MNQLKYGNVLECFKRLKSILYSVLLMNIKVFLEICQEFFEIIHPPIVFENESIKEKIDEENGWQELSDEDEPECGCNLCHITRQILSFINHKIYKKLNGNKFD